MNCTQQDDTGFNADFGKTWIYPTNLPIRKYQKDIVQEALFKNTMVCLPTGLGKTFIAAVVMYNYFRWYPSGKIVFMATTKPLVKQQVDACYKIVAIPKEITAELTGNVMKQNRQSIWEQKRVFFVTPQVLQNDLDSVAGLGSKIRCIVIDEAHRARGSHAYCEVINKLIKLNQNFRVLALTATPASNVLDIINICKQLLISHLEVRTEESPDVVSYMHNKTLETIVIKLDGKLAAVIEEYKNILDTYVRILVENNVIHSNFSSLHKGRLFYLSKEFQEKNMHNQSTDKYKLITKVFAICTILYHAYDLLLRHGMRSFSKFLEESVNKPLLSGSSADIQQLIQSINDYLGPPLVYDKLPNGSNLKLPENCKFGHPKFYKLQDIVKNHFLNNDINSKVIIFCEYKDSVGEIYASLLNQEAVKPKMFMGQSSITQKQQVNIIESFRNGCFNTLVSTCIGEEGIDVGFVDLVICFDISNKSSVRFIQRIGRTGRDRNGRVVMLVSEGREQQVLKECLVEKQHLCDTLLQARNIDHQLYKNDPKMIPSDVVPECQELFMAPKKTDITNYFKPASTSLNNSISLNNSPWLTDYTNLIPQKSLTSHEEVTGINEEIFQFRKNQHLQRTHHSMLVPMSKNTNVLVELLRQLEYARYNISILDTHDSEITGAQKKSNQFASKKQTDIRNMFKQQSQVLKHHPEDKSADLDMLMEAKMTNMLASFRECELCHHFENIMNIKRELTPIGNCNLNVQLMFDVSNINLLQRVINNKIKESLVDAQTIISENISSKIKSIERGETFSKELVNDCESNTILHKGSPLKSMNENEYSKHVTVQKSPDLFDDDFSQLISENQFGAWDLADDEKKPIADKNEIIEASPSSSRSKRKATESFVASNYRSRKRIKFNVTDIFDTSCLTSKGSKKIARISTSDIFDLDYSKTFRFVTPSNDSNTNDLEPNTASANANSMQEENMSADVINTAEKKISDDIFVTPSAIRTVPRRKRNLTSMDIWDATLCKGTPSKSNSPVISEPLLETVSMSSKCEKLIDLPALHEVLEQSPVLNNDKVNCNALKYDTNDKKTVVSGSSLDSEEEMQCLQGTNVSSSSLSSIEANCTTNTKKVSKKRRNGRYFIDSEADVSSDELHSGDEQISTEDDVYEGSFVDDDDVALPSSQTQAMYLRSVRSPALLPLVHKRPVARHVNDTICDQTIDLTYAKDTFCVDDLDEPIVLDESLDELEIAEMELKRRRKEKRAGAVITHEKEMKNVNRKRILRIDSDSD